MVHQPMEGVGEVSPVSECCGLKLKKIPKSGWSARSVAVQEGEWPKEAQGGPERSQKSD